MDKEQLAKELIKALEKEKGCPVQLETNTPDMEREYFGDFDERSVEVKRLSNLNPEYEHDVSLLEGPYQSLKELKETINRYDVIHGHGVAASNAYLLIIEKTGEKFLASPLSQNLYHNGEECEDLLKTIHKILEENGITYLDHRIIAKPDGLYDHMAFGGSCSVVDETKVADITLKLIE